MPFMFIEWINHLLLFYYCLVMCRLQKLEAHLEDLCILYYHGVQT
jgi:hypothetical protein